MPPVCSQRAPLTLKISSRSQSDALAWLKKLGDPYTKIGADTDGRVAIDFGAYGVPETYVVAADGTIADRIVGPLTQAALDQTLLPLIRSLQLNSEKGKE